MDVTHGPLHGGPDALGVPLHDFSTNSNACGPCPDALEALRSADATRYPDPAYTALRERLGAFHGVAPARIVIAGSASEFIHRITAFAARHGARAVAVPMHGYGDYARAANAWGLEVVPAAPGASHEAAGLHWACDPSSPLGTPDPVLAGWSRSAADDGALRVLDCAYAPLRLNGTAAAPMPADAWQLWTPNKALGLTGVRAAYAIAPKAQPPQDLAALQSLAPSWPTGAHGVALLSSWTAPCTQQWLHGSLDTLRAWKAQQQVLCESLGWTVSPGSLANYFVARPAVNDLPAALASLREDGIKLRDCASFGLPGQVRLGVLPLQSQQALRRAWHGGRWTASLR
ncbi:aminotransferase class I/II-fold pyridoxal phosphate-dependent enzyme [Acidovorax sp. SUPP3334]|uniref:aminotransferase class I/II-fold pyridoxal phosphate-dependent enzyme n=1 Tax=Acidovorax sp. SUPP3334 TaxID=2920881 RepID=UPI0023DE366B|nr:aminotransferase class I/II-fold pyridoxal phosphate-dependent enzyme [Acidovorax sp. SUPP3334]GKT22704.1 aminotransferase class I/II-fold pyridoxal phosphate-dependent enzyme [Acidovorax sp. SUPP3334]